MMKSLNPGKFDYVITFYAPVKAKDSIGDLVTTMQAQAGTVKGERIFKSSDEKIEGNQQVGIDTHDFRMMDIRNQYSVTLEWEFEAYQISNTANVTRYKVNGIDFAIVRTTIETQHRRFHASLSLALAEIVPPPDDRFSP